MKSAFLIKIQVKVFYIQIWFKCETPLLFFSNKTMVYRKKDLDYVKIIELHVYTHDFTCNLSRWNNGCNDIYKKDQ